MIKKRYFLVLFAFFLCLQFFVAQEEDASTTLNIGGVPISADDLMCSEVSTEITKCEVEGSYVKIGDEEFKDLSISYPHTFEMNSEGVITKADFKTNEFGGTYTINDMTFETPLKQTHVSFNEGIYEFEDVTISKKPLDAKIKGKNIIFNDEQGNPAYKLNDGEVTLENGRMKVVEIPATIDDIGITPPENNPLSFGTEDSCPNCNVKVKENGIKILPDGTATFDFSNSDYISEGETLEITTNSEAGIEKKGGITSINSGRGETEIKVGKKIIKAKNGKVYITSNPDGTNRPEMEITDSKTKQKTILKKGEILASTRVSIKDSSSNFFPSKEELYSRIYGKDIKELEQYKKLIDELQLKEKLSFFDKIKLDRYLTLAKGIETNLNKVLKSGATMIASN